MKHSMILIVALLGLNLTGCDGNLTLTNNGPVVANPTPTPTGDDKKTPVAAATEQPTLKSLNTCIDSGAVTENIYVNYQYVVNYTVSTYSDGSAKTSCKFAKIRFVSAIPCDLKINSSGLSNDHIAECPKTPTGMIHDLACDSYSYTFKINEYPGEGWAAHEISNPVLPKNCVMTNY